VVRGANDLIDGSAVSVRDASGTALGGTPTEVGAAAKPEQVATP